jgi:F0F1-type ATP synthase assembly protein I
LRKSEKVIDVAHDDDRRARLIRQGVWVSGMLSSLIASIVLGFVIGSYLDRYFKTSPWLMMVCLILGIVGGFLSVYKMIVSKEGRDILGGRR